MILKLEVSAYSKYTLFSTSSNDKDSFDYKMIKPEKGNVNNFLEFPPAPFFLGGRTWVFKFESLKT